MRESLQHGAIRKREYLLKRRQDAISDKSRFLDSQKNDISTFEVEASVLEKEEAQLI